MPNKKQPRAVIVSVHLQLLEKVLGLQPDVKITGVMHDTLTQTIILRLDSPNFPTVIEGAIPTRARLTPNHRTKKSSIDL